MIWSKRPRLTALLVLMVVVTTTNAQLATIPEQLARAGRSLSAGPSIPSGLPPSLDRILSDTDIIVRGVVGTPRSYLTEDQIDIYSDYPVRNAVVLYRAPPVRSQKLETSMLTVRLLGGSITISGLTFTSRHAALPSLESGVEYLLLLRRVAGNQYHIAGNYFGAFSIEDGKLTPSTKKHGFSAEYQGAPVASAQEQMVGRIRTLRE